MGRLPLSSRVPSIVLAVLACGVSAWISLSGRPGLDYQKDAGPAIDALVGLDLDTFFAEKPFMGTFSLLLRAPFAALAKLVDGSEQLVYELGAFPCLAAAGLLGVWLQARMAERGLPLLARAVVLGLCLVNPVTFEALTWGHPEELLGAALCVGAVAVATRDRPVLAGVLLGLALATKQWAVLAFLPVLVAAPGRRVRLGGVAILLAAALTLPGLLASGSTFAESNARATTSGELVGPPNVWWPLAAGDERRVFDGVEHTTVTEYSLPSELRGLPRPLIVLAAIPLSLLFLRRRRELEPADALGLLALVFLLRCLLDPWNISYYHAPLLLSLAGWEALRARGLPLLTMLATTGVWLTWDHVAPTLDYDLWFAFYLAWTLPLAAWIALSLYAPSVTRRLGKRVSTSGSPSPTTTRSSMRTPNAPLT